MTKPNFGPAELYSQNSFDGPIYRRYRPGLYRSFLEDYPALSASRQDIERDEQAEYDEKLGKAVREAAQNVGLSTAWNPVIALRAIATQLRTGSVAGEFLETIAAALEAEMKEGEDDK